MYKLVDGDMYKKGAYGVLMRCIPQEEGVKLLKIYMGGLCGAYASYRTSVGKMFR